MVKHYRPPVVSKAGWTEWQAPRMTAYKLGCCDCGLVHDFEFQVIRVTSQSKGFTKGKNMNRKKYKVVMRARRNARSTAAIRRYRKDAP